MKNLHLFTRNRTCTGKSYDFIMEYKYSDNKYCLFQKCPIHDFDGMQPIQERGLLVIFFRMQDSKRQSSAFILPLVVEGDPLV